MARPPDPRSWALVVGIDEYDDPAVPRLHGAAADAVAVVEWLRLLGVPDNQILLHAAPSEATRPSIESLAPAIVAQDAREPTIWGSVNRLLHVVDADRLFVFLSGHGLWEPTSGRLFLTQEAGINGRHPNLGIDLYADCFLSSAFPRQFLVMDGCLNLPYAPEQRQAIAAQIATGLRYTPRPANWLVTCFGAGFGEKAYEIDGRGAFLRRLLPAMQPDAPFSDGVRLDFDTGVRSVDLQAVMTRGVIEQVRRDAEAQVPSKRQTPQVQVRGTLGPGGATPVFDLLPTDAVRVAIAVDPNDAAADVESLRLWVDQRPWPNVDQPRFPGEPIPWPISVLLPANVDARATCRVRGNAPWDVESADLAFRTTADQAHAFRLRPRATTPPASVAPSSSPPIEPSVLSPPPLPAPSDAPSPVQSSPPPSRGGLGSWWRRGSGAGAGGDPIGVDGGHTRGIDFGQRDPGGPAPGAPAAPPSSEHPSASWEQFSVQVVWPNGQPAGALLGRAYDDVEAALGAVIEPVASGEIPHGPGSPWLALEPGIEIQRHETGPQFRVQSDALVRGRVVAASWASAIRNVLPDNLGVVTVRRGDEAPAAKPNLVLAFPPGGAAGIAGALANHRTVAIGAPPRPSEPVWRSGDGRTLAALEAAPELRVAPGPVEVRIDVPWGSWSTVVLAPDDGEPETIRLPDRIGTPPLRTVLLSESIDAEGTVIGIGSPPRRVSLRRRGATRATTIEPRPSASADRWRLRVPPPPAGAAPSIAPAIVRIERGSDSASFPILDGWSLAVDWSNDALRVEPLSRIDSPEWDLLVGTGRLDAVTTEEAVRLTQAKWFDPVLGLAGAYAVYAAADWRYLGIVTRNLEAIEPPIADVTLLAIAAEAGGAPPSRAARTRLRELAEAAPVPVMRWGVTLARSLIRRADLGAAAWDRELAPIEDGLSQTSVWTAWTDDTAHP